MNIETQLRQRSGAVCELSGVAENLCVYQVPHAPADGADACILISETCLKQIENPETMDPNHWRCLNDSMWSQVPAVQVVVWRVLQQLKNEGWPQDLLDMMYMDEDTLAWAATGSDNGEENVKHRDSNGAELQPGDTVVLVKDLNVKGTSFTAKRGTAVRKITLVHDNPEQIEGRVEGQQIVILTRFVKKG
ncbi:PhnA domain-containing protein [Sinomicrobium soli]|uniref:PhnA domain-containing protein n=1 Tax=Sinomicrobium sp. N-1-3-6 TaxID=2219864 RepID=UPI000DCC01CD|nr:alkylphosphonate utilization protein [Sinomicrobium sp. N-1-3-6]RAV28817.1 PhnA protein [Sinomicrobium sp. N-1-3-6]